MMNILKNSAIRSWAPFVWGSQIADDLNITLESDTTITPNDST